MRKGVTETAWNLGKTWIGFDLDKALTKALGKPVRACNDADVQGLGVVKGKGTELVITLGTGFGSSLFVDGRLVPNMQLAHHAGWRRKTYEEELGKKALKKAGKKRWNRRVLRAIASLEALFNYDTLYIGGGNADEDHRGPAEAGPDRPECRRPARRHRPLEQPGRKPWRPLTPRPRAPPSRSSPTRSSSSARRATSPTRRSFHLSRGW